MGLASSDATTGPSDHFPLLAVDVVTVRHAKEKPVSHEERTERQHARSVEWPN